MFKGRHFDRSVILLCPISPQRQTRRLGKTRYLRKMLSVTL
jgi:hypothetical protein